MKIIALANRLVRDLKVKSMAEITADGRQELVDAINSALQQLNELAPPHSKITTASILLEEPKQITLEVSNGSREVTNYVFGRDESYRTIRIEGDSIDNQVTGTAELLHPYGGQTGEVSATLYCDAIGIPEVYTEITSDPLLVEVGKKLINHRPSPHHWSPRAIARPKFWWMESNARNNNPAGQPAILRVDTLPDQSYRLEFEASLAPERVLFSDTLNEVMGVPMRPEHIESYLIPVARGILASSSQWRDPEEKESARQGRTNALATYSALIPKTTSNQTNMVGTARGF
jgi:hypothetical protein